MSNEVDNIEQSRLVGVLAQFDDPHTLLHACENMRDAGIKKMDAFTPFPIHGIEKAIGIPRTILPFIVLAVGLSGLAIGLGMQWYTNGTEQLGPIWSGYQFRISGKPYFSLPANIPVTFEVIVLSSAFAAFFGMLILNKLPRLANPLHRVARFKRVTNDKFFLMVEADDDSFNVDELRGTLTELGASDFEEVHEDLTDHRLPAFLKTVGVLALVLLMIPPALVYRARGMTYRETRLHVVPDMDFQHKYKAQTVGPIATVDGGEEDNHFFENIRGQFAPVPGTVSRDDQSGDIEFFRGIKAGSELHSAHSAPAVFASIQEEQENGEAANQEPAAETEAAEVAEPDWVTMFPNQIEVSRETVERGQRQFGIYCAVCHGYDGAGGGLVNQRAMALALSNKSAWTTAKAMHDPTIVEQPVGRIFDTITNGRATMGPYATRITPEDRWAIVLYIKALHEARKDAIPDEVPEEENPDSEDAD